MRKLILLVFCVTLFGTLAAHGETVPPDSLFSQANALYNKHEYKAAIDLYNTVLKDGYISSPDLYYNLGNAYYRDENIAAAIWCYEKCLLLDASNSEARANLEFVNRSVLGNIETVPENFFRYFWSNMYSWMSLTCWGYTFIALLALFLAVFLLFMLSVNYRRRRLFFVLSALFLMGTLLSLAQSLVGNYAVHHSPDAIVVHEASQLKSSPDQSGTGVALIQPGIRVHIEESKSPWIKVSLPDGTQGWMMESDVAGLKEMAPASVNEQ